MKTYSTKNKQRGALSIEATVITAFVVIAVIFIISQLPNIQYKYNEIKFLYQANEIVSATQSSKKNRPNYDGYDIKKVCEETSLSKSICGTANDGKNTNPFGGDWSLKPNTSSKALFDVKATIPQDTDRILSLANSIAGSTRGNCVEADGCSTVKTTTNSLEMTY